MKQDLFSSASILSVIYCVVHAITVFVEACVIHIHCMESSIFDYFAEQENPEKTAGKVEEENNADLIFWTSCTLSCTLS